MSDDDGIEDNTTQNPLNIYTTHVSYSYYNVSLIVNWSGAGSTSESETKTEYIRVWRPDAAPNYYRIVVTSSDNVSAGNVLYFNVTGSSNPINFNHTITVDEIEAGGFARNIAVECGFTGICGDVTCNGVVDTGDVILLSNYVGYYPGMP